MIAPDSGADAAHRLDRCAGGWFLVRMTRAWQWVCSGASCVRTDSSVQRKSSGYDRQDASLIKSTHADRWNWTPAPLATDRAGRADSAVAVVDVGVVFPGTLGVGMAVAANARSAAAAGARFALEWPRRAGAAG
jgi:hypothetical protein